MKNEDLTQIRIKDNARDRSGYVLRGERNGLLLSDGGDHLQADGIRLRGLGGHRTEKRGGDR